ncbi:MAG: glycosyltransferase family 39 protein [Planctomycetota bacterium]
MLRAQDQRARDAPHASGRTGRVGLWLAGLLLLSYAGWTATAAVALPATTDEALYLGAGRASLRHGTWDHPDQRFQGPFGLYFNQLWLVGEDASAYVRPVAQGVVARGRVGLLPFGLLAGALVFAWSRRAFGEVGGLLSLGAFCLHPLMVGYGALVNVDMAHAATTAGTAFLLWRLVRSPRAGGVLAVGAALGLALGTKYLAVVFAPCVAAVVVALGARGRRGARAVGRAALWAGLLVAAVLATLHAVYLFREGAAPLDPAAYRSAPLRGLAATPGLGLLLGATPHSYAIGLDTLLAFDDPTREVYLRGSYGPDRWSYYLWAVALKTPEPVLALLVAAAVCAGVRLARGTLADEERSTLALVALLIAVPLAALSFFSAYKVGIRYVLQLAPLAFVGLGVVGRALERGGVPRRWLAAAGGAAALLLGAELALAWPNQLAYYNRACGGSGRAYRYFNDSNSEWGQYTERGLELLRASEQAPFEALLGADGPRFGRVAVHLRELTRRDPESAAGGTRHWLDPFEPLASAGAAWWLFEVTPEDFERAAANNGTDARVREDLVHAWVLAGEVEPARRLVAELAPARRAPWEALLAGEAAPSADEGARGLAGAFLARGYPDIAVRLLADRDRLDARGATVLATAQLALRRLEAALALLEREAEERPDATNLLLLLSMDTRLGRRAEARALLERHRRRLADFDPARAAALEADLARAEAAYRLLE